MHLSRRARTVAAAAALFLALPASAQTWNLVWSDEFNGTPGTYPDTTKWSYEVGGGGWGNGEWETYCAPGSSAVPQ